MYLPWHEQRVKQKLIAAESKQRDKISDYIRLFQVIGQISLKCSLLPDLVAIESMLCKSVEIRLQIFTFTVV